MGRVGISFLSNSECVLGVRSGWDMNKKRKLGVKLLILGVTSLMKEQDQEIADVRGVSYCFK